MTTSPCLNRSALLPTAGKRLRAFPALLALLTLLTAGNLRASIGPNAQADYEREYPQYIDSKEPLSVLAERDMATWSYQPLSALMGSNVVKVADVAYGPDPKQQLDIYHPKAPGKRPVMPFLSPTAQPPPWT